MDQHADNAPDRRPSTVPEVMIFGGGRCAREIALNLKDCGFNACLAARTDSPPDFLTDRTIERFVDAELVNCRGFAGDYHLTLTHRQGVVQKTVPAIVVAEDAVHIPNHDAYGLTPEPRIMAISALEKVLQEAELDNPIQGPATVVFLCGWHNQAQPTVAMRMIESCFQLQCKSGISTTFMTGNLKVAADGAEKRVQEAKRSGAIFLKFTDDYPAIGLESSARLAIDYIDELTRTPFRMQADWIVVDEIIKPAHHLTALAKGLGIHRDDAGFAQADNVRRMSNSTNRRGIFVAGGGRGVMSADEQLTDAEQVSLAVMAFLQDADSETLPPAVIQRGRCARCLTCHRLCPHMAVEIGAHISIVPEACQRCGLCVAGCPAHAIGMEGVEIDIDIKRRLEAEPDDARSPTQTPQIMVFGCARSAGQALGLIRTMGKRLPNGVQIVEVPCGGSIASRHVLNAFERGADGVMLCICHNDNCRSQTGNLILRQRVASMHNLLSSAGLESDRLRIAPVAANMGNELAEMIASFVREIGERVGGQPPVVAATVS